MFDQSLIELDYSTENISSHIHPLIDQYGVCIIKNILPDLDCRKLFDDVCSTLNYITSDYPQPFDISNPQS